jgi:hypothetical protein
VGLVALAYVLGFVIRRTARSSPFFDDLATRRKRAAGESSRDQVRD